MFIIVDTKDLEELKIPLPPDGSVNLSILEYNKPIDYILSTSITVDKLIELIKDMLRTEFKNGNDMWKLL